MNLNMKDWIAENPDEYVSKAIKFSSNLNQLSQIRMNLRDIDLIDKPISTKDYTIYNIDDLPKTMLGFRVKHKFDEARLKIKSKYKPKYISHFSWTSELEPTFIYGIEINLKKRLQSLLTAINNLSLIHI